MAFDPAMDDPAIALFLGEAGELCQQFEEGLLFLTHEPSPLYFKKIVRRAQTIAQGAGSVGLVDLQLLALGLSSLLECYGGDPAQAQNLVLELLHQVCDSLQCSLIVHRSTSHPVEGTNRPAFVLNALIPKALEILKLISVQSLEASTQRQLLQQQIEWMQWWSNELDLTAFKTIAEATSRAIAIGLNTVDANAGYSAIVVMAIAGFQVAHRATLQQLAPFELEPISETEWTEPQVLHAMELDVPPLTTLDLSQHLAGLARHTIFCISTQSIEEIVLPLPHQRVYHNGQAHLHWNGTLLILHRWADLWRSPEQIALPREQTPPDELILVLKHEPQPLALALEVDRLIVDPELTLAQPDHISADHISFNHISVAPHPCRWGWTRMDEDVWVEVVDVNALIQARFGPDALAIALDPVALPIPTHEPRAMVSAAAAALPLPVWAPPKTILVVDDSKMVRELLSVTLKAAGYQVVQAKDGQEAIAHLQQQAHIHLTICDLEMSNLNGFEFLRHRLQDPRWMQIPVLILSSHTSDEYRQLAQKLGAADYLTIPYEPLRLLQTIQNLLK